MNKLIDLGSHLFEGINLLLDKGNVDSTYTVYSFEANPFICEKASEKLLDNSKKFKNLYLYNYAAGDSDGTIYFNLDETNLNQACNILENPPEVDIWYKSRYKWKKIPVPSISAKSLIQLCDIKLDDNVKIKCDIEGAEFCFLWDLLKLDDISFIKEMYVEWHHRYWYPEENKKEEEKNILIDKFREKNILINEWM